MSIEAMKQALEALEYAMEYNRCDDLLERIKQTELRAEPAITSLRQAIAEAEKQVAFKIYKPTSPRHAIPNVRDAELPWVYDQDPSSGNVASMWVTPVKATLQPQQAESITQITQDHYSNQNEPVAWVNWCAATGKRSVSFECESELASQPLYTTPQPQRECEGCDYEKKRWVGLTPADFDWLEQVFANKVSNNFVFADIVCVISAKLKERNS